MPSPSSIAPRVLYHGSADPDITSFDLGRSESSPVVNDLGPGIYTSDSLLAGKYYSMAAGVRKDTRRDPRSEHPPARDLRYVYAVTLRDDVRTQRLPALKNHRYVLRPSEQARIIGTAKEQGFGAIQYPDYMLAIAGDWSFRTVGPFPRAAHTVFIIDPAAVAHVRRLSPEEMGRRELGWWMLTAPEAALLRRYRPERLAGPHSVLGDALTVRELLKEIDVEAKRAGDNDSASLIGSALAREPRQN